MGQECVNVPLGDNRLLFDKSQSDRRHEQHDRDDGSIDGATAHGLGTECQRGFEGEVETMADLNKVFLMGSLTFDPELRRTPSGTAVSELRMVTSRTWMSREGERKEEKLFIDVTVWDRQAENCCQFLRKGSAIHVEGSLKMDTWDDKTTGEKRSKIKVQAERVQFLDSRRSSDSGGGGSVSLDDESGPPAAREVGGMRRGSPGPSRGGPGGGYGEPRPSNGPARPPYPSNGPSSHSSIGDEHEEDDIPF